VCTCARGFRAHSTLCLELFVTHKAVYAHIAQELMRELRQLCREKGDKGTYTMVRRKTYHPLSLHGLVSLCTLPYLLLCLH
jgi:hypothetical protein